MCGCAQQGHRHDCMRPQGTLVQGAARQPMLHASILLLMAPLNPCSRPGHLVGTLGVRCYHQHRAVDGPTQPSRPGQATLFCRSFAAFASSSTFTTASCPFSAPHINAVHPSCRAHQHSSHHHHSPHHHHYHHNPHSHTLSYPHPPVSLAATTLTPLHQCSQLWQSQQPAPW